MNIFKINKIFINFLFLIIFLFNTSCSVYQKKEKIVLEDDTFDEENYFTDSFFVKDQNINNLWQSYNNKNYNFDYELIEFIEFDFGQGEKNYKNLISNPIINNNFIYLIDNESLLTKFNLIDKKILWQKKILEDNIEVVTPLSLSIVKDNIILTAGHGKVICINLDGDLIWSKDFSMTIKTPSYSINDLFVILLNDGEIIALDYNNGDIIWRYNKTSDKVASSDGGKIFEYKNYLIIVSPKNQIHFIDYFFGEYSQIDNVFFETFEPLNFNNLDYSLDINIYKNDLIYIENNRYYSIFNLEKNSFIINKNQLPESKFLTLLNNSIFSLDIDNNLRLINIQNNKVFWKNNLNDFLDKDESILRIINTKENFVVFTTKGKLIFFDKFEGIISNEIDLKIKDLKYIYLNKDYIIFIDKKANINIYK